MRNGCSDREEFRKSFNLEEKEFYRILERVVSLPYYQQHTLPRAEQKLAGIVEKLRAGQQLAQDDLFLAVTHRISARTALQEYPNDSVVQESASRIAALYGEIRKQYPQVPE